MILLTLKDKWIAKNNTGEKTDTKRIVREVQIFHAILPTRNGNGLFWLVKLNGWWRSLLFQRKRNWAISQKSKRYLLLSFTLFVINFQYLIKCGDKRKNKIGACFCRVFAEVVKTKVSKKIKDEIEVLCRQIYYNCEYNQKKNKSYAKNIFCPITLKPLFKKYQ